MSARVGVFGIGPAAYQSEGLRATVPPVLQAARVPAVLLELFERWCALGVGHVAAEVRCAARLLGLEFAEL